MLKTRVIPCLLLNKNGGLVKTEKFKNPKYVGDPINAVKIFNEKEVDEIVVLDIEASKEKRGPNFELLSKITREAFMPMGYGGGVTKIEEVEKLFYLGFEKVVINNTAIENPEFIKQASDLSGSQSIVVCVDVKKDIFGRYHIYKHNDKKTLKLELIEYIKKVEKMGAGELIINSVDQDGTFKGYDLDLIKSVSDVLSIPLVAMGGAGRIEDFSKAVNIGKASAVAAGSFFVFHGIHRAVLITYPNKKELEKIFQEV